MKIVASLYISIILCILISACAKKPVENLPSVTRPEIGLKAKKKQYTYDYGDTVKDVSTVDVFVVCCDCNIPQLARATETPAITMSFSKDPAPVKLVSALTDTTLIQSMPSVPPSPPEGEQVSAANDKGTEPEKERAAAKEPEQPALLQERKDVNPVCLLAKVQFDLGDATIKPAEQQKLKDKVVASLKDVKDPVLQIHGYTCDLGTKKYNDKLAVDRAKAVAVFLESNGIKPVMVTGEGKCCYVSKEPQKNRRAVITYLNDKSAVNPAVCEPREIIN